MIHTTRWISRVRTCLQREPSSCAWMGAEGIPEGVRWICQSNFQEAEAERGGEARTARRIPASPVPGVVFLRSAHLPGHFGPLEWWDLHLLLLLSVLPWRESMEESV